MRSLEAQLRTKFDGLVAPRLGAERATRQADASGHVDDLVQLDELTARLGRTTEGVV